MLRFDNDDDFGEFELVKDVGVTFDLQSIIFIGPPHIYRIQTYATF